MTKNQILILFQRGSYWTSDLHILRWVPFTAVIDRRWRGRRMSARWLITRASYTRPPHRMDTIRVQLLPLQASINMYEFVGYFHERCFVCNSPWASIHTPYSDIPEGCVLVYPQNAHVFTFSDRLLTISHAMYLVFNKVSSDQAKITVFLQLLYV